MLLVFLRASSFSFPLFSTRTASFPYSRRCLTCWFREPGLAFLVRVGPYFFHSSDKRFAYLRAPLFSYSVLGYGYLVSHMPLPLGRTVRFKGSFATVQLKFHC